MMWHTHAAIGASATWLLMALLPQDDWGTIAVVMVFCVIGALVPDLDAVESKIKHVKTSAKWSLWMLMSSNRNSTGRIVRLSSPRKIITKDRL